MLARQTDKADVAHRREGQRAQTKVGKNRTTRRARLSRPLARPRVAEHRRRPLPVRMTSRPSGDGVGDVGV